MKAALISSTASAAILVAAAVQNSGQAFIGAFIASMALSAATAAFEMWRNRHVVYTEVMYKSVTL